MRARPSKTSRAQEEQDGFRERPEQSERFFRDGRSGQWRDVLSAQQVARIVRDHAEQMGRFGYLPAASASTRMLVEQGADTCSLRSTSSPACRDPVPRCSAPSCGRIPRCHAGMTSPVGSLVTALLRQMSQDNETAVFIDDTQRDAVLDAVFDAYYRQVPASTVVFDTNRLWCTKLPLLSTLFPRARVIACVRHVPWILDSIERLVRRNRFEPSKIFNFEPGGTVYSRIEGLGSGTGMVGFAWNALREAFYGEEADRMLLLTYETLTSDPSRALMAIYDFIGEPPFAHDFENVEFDAAEFDRRLGTPGLHAVGRRVTASEPPHLITPRISSTNMSATPFGVIPSATRTAFVWCRSVRDLSSLNLPLFAPANRGHSPVTSGCHDFVVAPAGASHDHPLHGAAQVSSAQWRTS